MIKNILDSIEQLKLTKGIEASLLKRKRRGILLTSVTIVFGIAKIISEMISKDEAIQEYFARVWNFTIVSIQYIYFSIIYVFTGQENPVKFEPAFDVLGIYIIILGIIIYYLNRYTSLLFKESEEPFQYTFWIERFNRAEDKQENPAIKQDDDIHHLLHHDLMDMLNKRIGRFSLLDEQFLTKNKSDEEEITELTPPSHIHIDGHYSIRERDYEGEQQKFIQVSARVRIGTPGNASILTSPVEIQLNYKEEDKKIYDENSAEKKEERINDEQKRSNGNNIKSEKELIHYSYKTVLEQVYSRVSSEIYRQIRNDLNKKVLFFPTKYLRAVALFYEAEDFAKSNTIDAYDLAIDLYKNSIAYFDVFRVKWLTDVIIKLPVIWRFKVKLIHMQAMVQIGYSKCLAFRRQVSSLSGRKKNNLFESRIKLEEEISLLCKLHYKIGKNRLIKGYKKNSRFFYFMAHLTFPKDTWMRNRFRFLLFIPSMAFFEKQTAILFNAYLVYGLTNYYMDDILKATECLKNARAVDPQLSENSSIFLLCAGLIERDLNKSIRLLRQATEISSDFQIAQHLLAYKSDMLFRRENDIVWERAKSVLSEYEKVLKINPGNIAALAAQGYIYWLVKHYRESKRKFEEGCNIKAIKSETFIGELKYGLARIAIEDGNIDLGYSLYKEAIESDPSIAIYSSSFVNLGMQSYYEFIDLSILKRFEDLKIIIEKLAEKSEDVTEYIKRAVISYVFNEFSNACLNYYLRFGYEKKLDYSIKYFKKSIGLNPNNIVARYNLVAACQMRNYIKDADISNENFKYIIENAATWQEGIIFATTNIINNGRKIILEKKGEIDNIEKKIDDVKKGIGNLEGSKKDINDKKNNQIQDEKVLETFGDNKNVQGSYQFLKHEDPVKDQAQEWKKKELEEKKKELEEMKKELKSPITDGLKSIIENTRLAPLFAGYHINYEGKGIDELIKNKKKIKWGRFDESDVYALKAWAKIVLSWANIEEDKIKEDKEKSDALNKTYKMNLHLLERYLPANFDIFCDILPLLDNKDVVPYPDQLLVKFKSQYNFKFSENELNENLKFDLERKGIIISPNRIVKKENEELLIIKDIELHRVYKLYNKNNSICVYLGTKETYQELIIYIINFWLKKDFFWFAALTWVPLYFYKDDALKKLKEVLEKKPEHPIKKEIALLLNDEGNKYYFEGNYKSAIDKYRESIKFYGSFYIVHENLAMSYKKEIMFNEAKDEYLKAIEILNKVKDKYLEASESNDLEKYYKSEVALIFNDEGNKYYSNGDYVLAINKYEQAIKFNPNYDIYYSNLGLAYENVKTPGKRIEFIEEAIKAYNSAHRIAKEKHYDKKIESLNKRKKIIELYGEKSADYLNIVTPIVVEVAADLVRFVSNDMQITEELNDYVINMRDRIKKKFGVVVPGVRFRGNDAGLPGGSYIIMLSEIPIILGKIYTEKRFFLGSKEDLDKLNIQGEEVNNPQTNERGYWIEKKDWEEIEKLGLELWDIIEYPIRHLESIILKNLADFIGHQEVLNYLKPEDLKESFQKLTAFTNVCKGLIAEGVPLKPLKALENKFNELYPNEQSLLKISEAIRSLPEFNINLPGNSEKNILFKLGKRFEEEIKNSIYKNNSYSVLAMEPEWCQQALSCLRNKIANSNNYGLLVEDSEIRHFMRKLIEIEFPDVPVLSKQELKSEINYNIIGEIEIEEGVITNQNSFGESQKSSATIDRLTSKELNNKNIIDNEPVKIKVFVQKEFSINEFDNEPIKELFKLMQDGLFYELGIILPEIQLEFDTSLIENKFRFELNDLKFGPFVGLQEDEFLVNEINDGLKKLNNILGKETENPANGNESTIVKDRKGEANICRQSGLTIWGKGGYLVLKLSSEIRKNASKFIPEFILQQILESLKPSFPSLIEAFLSQFSMEKLQLILMNLLEEEISIRDLRNILESLLSINGTYKDNIKFIVFNPNADGLCPVLEDKTLGNLTIDEYASYVRMNMKRYISHKYTRGNSTLVVYLLDPEIEKTIQEMDNFSDYERKAKSRLIIEAISKEIKDTKNPIILTVLELRKNLWKLTHSELPQLVVLAYQELSYDLSIQPIARISLLEDKKEFAV